MSEDIASNERVKLIEKTTPYEGFFQLDRYRFSHVKFEGGWTPPLVREVFERRHAVAILLYDPDREVVVLVEQFRIGAFAAGLEPWLLEPIAGIIEPGEGPEEVARRESIEEAGARVQDIEKIGTFILSPGGSSETVTIFCGRIDSRGLGGVHGVEDEGEDIAVRLLSLPEALAGLADGRIHAAIGVIPLQWLALNQHRLHEKWL